MDETVIAAIATVWLIFGFFGGWIGVQKRRGFSEGFLLGCLFGPLGCLVEAVLPLGQPKTADAAKADADRFEDRPRETPAERLKRRRDQRAGRISVKSKRDEDE